MIPAPFRQDPETVARLALRIHQRIPSHALVVSTDTLHAIAWHTGDEEPGPIHATSPCYMHVLHSLHRRPTLLSMARSHPFTPAGVVAAIGSPETSLGPSLVLREMRHEDAPPGPPGRMEAIEALVRGTDAAALLLMDETSLSGEAVYRWLSQGRPNADANREFARSHPWLAAWTSTSVAHAWTHLLRTGGPDGAAEAVLAQVIERDDPRLPALVRRMRGFVLPETTVGEVEGDAVLALLDLPPDAFPPPLPPGADQRGDDQQGYLALYALATETAALARLSGRTPRSVLGKIDSWPAYARSLPRRAGLGEEPANYPDDWGAIIPADVVREIFDMVRIFANEVLSPALTLRGTPWDGPFAHNAGGRSFEMAAIDPVMAAATRLLLGERTLAALAETCGRWHVRSNAISRLIAGLAGPKAPTGPLLIPDTEIGDGLYLTCLNTVPDLLDEGAPGPDATGAMGLFHCVGGFGYQVAMGHTGIVSVRRRLPDGGYERVSTIEVNFNAVPSLEAPEIVQHKGHRNAPPDEDVVARANLALFGHRHAGYAALQAFVPSHEAWESPADTIVRTGAWESVRDAWAFALTRPLRTLGHGALLRAAGL